jgi:hypothetical protein
MSREDEEHIAFITVDDLFCYVSMPYGIKSALPTFVRAMHKTFRDLIRALVEVYVDDIIVKIKSHSSLLDNLAIVLNRLRSMCMMLNPDKCVFKVSTEKLLGFLILHWGIEANPEKIKAIEEMRPPGRIKDVQKHTRCLVTLNWFISRLAEQALPFFKLLWKSEPFVWTEEADVAFQELKQYLTSLPIMVALKLGEHLLLYITAKAKVVSMVLVVEWPKPKQPQALKGSPVAGSRSQDPGLAEGSHDQELPDRRSRSPSWALNPNRGPGSRRCPQVSRTKRLLGPRSRTLLRVSTTSTPWGPSPRRCPRILGAKSPRLSSQWRSIHCTP